MSTYKKEAMDTLADMIKEKRENVMNTNKNTNTAPRWATIAIAITRPILRLGTDLLFTLAFSIGAGIGLFAALVLSNYIAQAALMMTGMSLQNDLGILTAGVCYIVTLVVYFRFLPTYWRKLKRWTDGMKTFYSYSINGGRV